jgi:hypothetical protein
VFLSICCVFLQSDLAATGCPCPDQGYMPVLPCIFECANDLSLMVDMRTDAEGSRGALDVSFAVRSEGASAGAGARLAKGTAHP